MTPTVRPRNCIDFAHPFGVAFGEVVVDGDDVDAVACERVEVAGESSDEGFSLAGVHFGDFAGMEDHAADELDVEVAHADCSLAGLSDEGKSLGKNLVEGCFFSSVDAVEVFLRSIGQVEFGADSVNALTEFGCFVAKSFVGERLNGGLEVINLLYGRHEALDSALVAGAKDFCDSFVEQNRYPSGRTNVPFTSVNGVGDGRTVRRVIRRRMQCAAVSNF